MIFNPTEETPFKEEKMSLKEPGYILGVEQRLKVLKRERSAGIKS